MSQEYIDPGWLSVLSNEFQQPYFLELRRFVVQERANYQVFPPKENLLRGFLLTPWDQVKVVLLGQDPYHGVGQAHGLCFSVPNGVPIPKSLQNIYKELETDMQITPPQSGNLESWAQQGVLMLNAILTVRAHSAGSHRNKGWETFTDAVIRKLSDEKSGLIFLLWGNYAHAKKVLIDQSKHYIIEAPHPSPLSAHAGFFGSKPFSKINNILVQEGKKPIEWDSICRKEGAR